MEHQEKIIKAVNAELIVNKKKIRRQQIWRLRGTEGYHLHMGGERRKNK